MLSHRGAEPFVLIRRRGLAGERKSLGAGFEISKAQSLSLLRVNGDVELSTSLVTHLPAMMLIS